MKNNILDIIYNLKQIFVTTLGIKESTDFEKAIERIKGDISFKGHSAWILMCSIFIASIGLNANSTAVIIGAMLISPLMGPILGIGYSIAVHDFDTLMRSFKNLAIAIAISLFTSTIYFLITPLDIAQSELLARTKPTILDVLVAFLGGFAGIIAVSRKQINNVIPGVAIATALMPPLCTAGFGLAQLNAHYFFGAIYLFLINSIFISFATFLMVRYLDFPIVRYIDKNIYKKYKLYISIILIITIIPSGVIFFEVIQETRFNVSVESFVKDKCNFKGSELINYKYKYDKNESTIDLYFIGNSINEEKVYFLNNSLSNYNLNYKNIFSVTKKTTIHIRQQNNQDIDFEKKMEGFNNDLKLKILEDIYTKNEEVIKNKDLKIKLLEEQVLTLSQKETFPFNQINNELQFQSDKINKFSFSNTIELETLGDSIGYDTIPLFLVHFDKKYNSSLKDTEIKSIQEWLKIRLGNEKIKVIEY